MTVVGPITSPQVRAAFEGLPHTTAAAAARVLMTLLESDTAIVDPVVSASPVHGELSISFELADPGADLATQVGKAMRALGQAVDRATGDGVPPGALARPASFELRAQD